MAAACMLSRQRAPRRSWCRYKRCVGSITPPLWKRYEYSLPRGRGLGTGSGSGSGAGLGLGLGLELGLGLGFGLRVRLARRPVDRVPGAALGVVLERSLQMVEAHVVRQHGVDGPLEGLRVVAEALARNVEVDRLPPSVNSSVCPAGRDHSNVLLRALGQRRLELAGNGRCILLKLRTGVRQPVIHEPRTITHVQRWSSLGSATSTRWGITHGRDAWGETCGLERRNREGTEESGHS